MNINSAMSKINYFKMIKVTKKINNEIDNFIDEAESGVGAKVVSKLLV